MLSGLINKHASGLQAGYVRDYGEEVSKHTRDLCIKGHKNRIGDADLQRRKDNGLITTFYTYWNPARPNTFTASLPIENVWFGWHAAAAGFDGYLRWGLNHWNSDPFETSDYFNPVERSGDAWLIYPGPRSSMRFERLREGIQDFEKIRIIRKKLSEGEIKDQSRLAELDRILQIFKLSDTGMPLDNVGTPGEIARDIQIGREILNGFEE